MLAIPDLKIYAWCRDSTFMKEKLCKCADGDIGRKKIREENEKRRAFYKTAKRLAVKKAYKQRAVKHKYTFITVCHILCHIMAHCGTSIHS